MLKYVKIYVFVAKMKHLRYLGTFFVVCVLPAAILLSRMDITKIKLAIVVSISSIIFFVLADKVLIKNTNLSGAWGYDFNPKSILGWWPFGIPFEEHVFIITSILLPIAFWEFIKKAALGLTADILLGLFVMILLVVISPFIHHLDV